MRDDGQAEGTEGAEQRFLDFIEVGTSDFDTLVQKASNDDLGLSIEPLRAYLDRLPSPSNCEKLCAAISDRDGVATVFHVRPERVVELGLSSWVRGCNTLGAPHPAVVKLLKSQGLDPAAVLEQETVPVYRLATVFRRFGLSGAFRLKVDTEGHDGVILEDFFAHCETFQRPHHLRFESNWLGDKDRFHRLVVRLIQCGYDIVSISTQDGASESVFDLNLKRVVNGSRYSPPIAGYYLGGYPKGYNPLAPPHEATLAGAQAWCASEGFCGVTRQDGRFEVRGGWELMKEANRSAVTTWIRM